MNILNNFLNLKGNYYAINLLKEIKYLTENIKKQLTKEEHFRSKIMIILKRPNGLLTRHVLVFI